MRAKKRWMLLFILFLCMTILFGCQTQRSVDDTDDYNTTAFSWLGCPGCFAAVEDGIYFISGNYLFFMDSSSMKSTPVCYKAGCLHHKETDPTRRPGCNAYLGVANSMNVSYITAYGEKLYATLYDLERGILSLTEMNYDGSSRETIIEDLNYYNTRSFVCHRGVLYCPGQENDMEGNKISFIDAVDLKQRNISVNRIYASNTENLRITKVLPYRDYLFFNEMIDSEDESQIQQSLVSLHLKKKNTVHRIDDSYSIYGAYENKLILMKDFRYYCLTIGTENIEPDERFNSICELHPNWQCHPASIDRDIAFVTYYDLEAYDNTGSGMSKELIVADQEGNEVCVLEDMGWDSKGAVITKIGDEEYYFQFSRSSEPFELRAYKKSDLLKGIILPTEVLHVEDYNKELLGSYAFTK